MTYQNNQRRKSRSVNKEKSNRGRSMSRSSRSSRASRSRSSGSERSYNKKDRRQERKKESFLNIENELPTKEQFINLFNKIDNKVSDMFDYKFREYRWFFVIGISILILYVISELLFSNSSDNKSSQPTIILEIPQLNQPNQMTNIPIKITDLKKTGGFNVDMFSELETSIFSDMSSSD